MPEATELQTVSITLDGRAIDARPGELLIAAAERHGVYIPRFCWHPRMKPVGMCRMCLVDVKGPRGFSLQPACFVPVADGQEVVTTSDRVKKAQDGVLEFLLVNHPLDCPVCDRGGECPLQDQTFAFGPGESRFVEEKRHFEKPIPISSLVGLDRERCIQCARCTRFAEEVAGDPLIDFVSRGDQIEVATFPDEPFTSYFSGNTVQICPVGALTATPYRFRARPWDLEQLESTCTTCAVGCRVTLQSSANRLVRMLGVDSDPVNHGWLCDKGRFGYEAADADNRLTTPLVKKARPEGEPEGGDEQVEASWSEALEAAATAIRDAVTRHGPGSVAVLGGARLTNEDAYAWTKLAKNVVGTDSVDCQLGDGLPAEAVLGLPRATVDDACRAGAVVLLAPDLKEELPVLYLRLREAVVDGGVPLVEITPQRTGLSRHATATLLHRPGEAVSVARALVGGPGHDAGGVAQAEIARAADLLRDAGSVVVVLGRPSLAESGRAVADTAVVLARGLPAATFLPALRRGNVMGALDMGMAPGVLPGRVSLADGRAWFSQEWGRLPEETGLDADGILAAAAEGRVQVLVLLGADPLTDFPDRVRARAGLAAAGFVVAVDTHAGVPSARADVVLPAAGYGEKGGTTTNIEGRVSRLGQKVTAPGTARPDWMIAAELAAHIGEDLGFLSTADVWAEIERMAPSHAGVTADVVNRNRDGVVPPLDGHAPAGGGEAGASLAFDIERQAVASHAPLEAESTPAADAHTTATDAPDASGPVHDPVHDPDQEPARDAERPPALRFDPEPGEPPPVDAYSLRLVTTRRLYDSGAVVRSSPSLAPLVAGPRLRANPADLDRLGVRTGDRVRLSSPRGSLTLEVEADGGVPAGAVSLTFNQPGADAAELIDASQPVTDVRMETVG